MEVPVGAVSYDKAQHKNTASQVLNLDATRGKADRRRSIT